MTYTPAKRFIRTPSQSLLHGFETCNMTPGSSHEAADLAATLRVLASKAHEAVKAIETRQRHLTCKELDDLRIAIGCLENEFRAQNLRSLIPYVVALRQQVETKLT
jgi:hypothetical protein